jgi:aconitate hydratase
VAIAAITSCTNTSNPTVMVAAALLAKNAVERGLRTKPWVKTSLSPGSRVVTDYYDAAGLTPYLDKLGFHLAGYGCMTCIGASGPLIEEVSAAVTDHNLAVVSVLSGNRNFDGRINPDIRMNYLASPPLVIAYAIAGTMDTDLLTDPLGTDPDGHPVYLRDVWPTSSDVQRVIDATLNAGMFTGAYADVFAGDERWRALDAPTGATFDWDQASTYVRRPPYLDGMTRDPKPVQDIHGARVLVKLGDSVTTDHVSPAGAIPVRTPAGQYLTGLGVERFALNTYASRRGNHEVMMRGTFANVRLRNQLVPGTEGGYTHNFLTDSVQTVYDAAMTYRAADVALLVLAGKDYGSGSSRDWAAKGPALLGVRAVLAESFERIHRSNLVGMGILPLQFLDGENADSLGLTGTESFTVTGLADPGQHEFPATVTVTAGSLTFRAAVRLDTAREASYYRHGGIMKYVLRQMRQQAPSGDAEPQP